jgi:hypothetical protein
VFLHLRPSIWTLAVVAAIALAAGLRLSLWPPSSAPLVATRSSNGVRAQVTAVQGMHEGRCGRARIMQVQRDLQEITSADLAWRNHCSCFPESSAGVKQMYKRSEDLRLPQPRTQLVHVFFARPVKLPREGPAKDRVTLDIIAAAQDYPLPVSTSLWLGRYYPSRKAVLYEAIKFRGDPFQLAHGECTGGASKS